MRKCLLISLVALLWMAAMSPVVAAPPRQGGQVVHVVQVGETLTLIARKYGVTVDEIVVANGLTDPNLIEVGQRLVIPVHSSAVQSTVYVVRAGDTLAMIARQHGVDVQDLARLNHLTNPSLIYVGQRLIIPASTSKGGQVYVVRPGDTLARIASRYEVSVWLLAQANQLANPNVIHVGQRLLIPADEASFLPAPLISLEILPPVAVQGRTVRVIVETEGEASIGGSYDGRPLFFVGEGGRYRTLIGIPAMSAPGLHPLELRVVQGESSVSLRTMIHVVEGNFGVQYLRFSGDKAQLLDPKVVVAESKRIWKVTTQATLPGMWQGRFRLPLDGDPPISTPFGMRRSYNGGPPRSSHGGIDYSVPEGTPVYAPARGRVVLAEQLQVRGNAVIINHGRGVMTGYWHLSQVDVRVGQVVEVGDLLGKVGSTGLSTGAHLHWELRVMGVPVDPLQWVSQELN